MIEAQIEQIVGEVMRRLNAGGRTAVGRDKSTTATDPTATHRDGGVMRTEQKVVSLAQLDGQLDGISQLVVSPDAVITPSARDELHDREIAIGVSTARSELKSTSMNVVVGTWNTTEDCSAAEAVAMETGSAVTKLQGDSCLSDLYETIARKECDLAVLITDRPVLAACHLTRPPNVRPVIATDEQTVDEGLQDIGANVLIVSSRLHDQRTRSKLIQMFFRFGHRECSALLNGIIVP